MLLADLATTSSALAATRSRKAKRAPGRPLAPDHARRRRDRLAYLGGQLRQRRTGLGWRGAERPARPRRPSPTLTVAGVDAVFEEMSRHWRAPGR